MCSLEFPVFLKCELPVIQCLGLKASNSKLHILMLKLVSGSLFRSYLKMLCHLPFTFQDILFLLERFLGYLSRWLSTLLSGMLAKPVQNQQKADFSLIESLPRRRGAEEPCFVYQHFSVLCPLLSVWCGFKAEETVLY